MYAYARTYTYTRINARRHIHVHKHVHIDTQLTHVSDTHTYELNNCVICIQVCIREGRDDGFQDLRLRHKQPHDCEGEEEVRALRRLETASVVVVYECAEARGMPVPERQPNAVETGRARLHEHVFLAAVDREDPWVAAGLHHGSGPGRVTRRQHHVR